FFRLKWTRKLDDASARYGFGGRVECWIPPRHLVLESGDKLYVHDANDGRLVRAIPLPPEARKTTEGIGDGTPDFVYLRDGDSGFAVGNQTLYEVTHKTPNSSSYRSIGERWLCLRDNGELLWEREETNPSRSVQIHALPVGENRDWLLAASWRGFQIMDARQNVILEQNQGMAGGRWIFRLAPGGEGVEALVIGQDIACYDFVPTADGGAPEGERIREEKPARAQPPPPVEPMSRSKIDACSERLEKNPDDVLSLRGRGFLYAMVGDAKHSRKDFEAALRLAPEDQNVPLHYGWALLNLDDCAGAAKQWKRWLKLDKTVPPEADYHLALAYWGDGQKEKALKIFNAAVAREPNFWISREHAGRYTARWTEKEKAAVYGLYDAWSRVYSPPAAAADYPLPEPDPTIYEPNLPNQE
ncbi:MAG: tetratricopeptide repeat protein, partial [Kiritimatiellia bacterium]